MLSLIHNLISIGHRKTFNLDSNLLYLQEVV